VERRMAGKPMRGRIRLSMPNDLIKSYGVMKREAEDRNARKECIRKKSAD